MRKKWDAWTWIVLVLMGLGVWRTIATGQYHLLLLIALVTVVALLFKYPPKRFAKKPLPREYRLSSSRSGKRVRAKPKRKEYPFRVIEGRKRDDRDNQNNDKKWLH